MVEQADVRQRPVSVRLRLLATSDLHMHLSDYDYQRDMPGRASGLAMTAALISEARREVPGSVLLDNGDFLQGSPLGDYVALHRHHPHPMVQAMAHLGYDAVNIGNHEFSHGIDLLALALADAPFPCLSANTINSVVPNGGGPHHFLPPWTIVQRDLCDAEGQMHRLRIGVIGVLPPETGIWDKQAIAGQVHMLPMAESVALHLPEIRAAGADIVVVLAHCGPGTAHDGSGGGGGARPIAALPGVDAVVMGHVHRVFPGPDMAESPDLDPKAGTLCGKPAVMPGFFGSHLGIIDLELLSEGGTWRVRDHRVEARAIVRRDAEGTALPPHAADAALVALSLPAHLATLAWVRKPIGRTDRPIESFYSMVTDSLAVQLVNRAQQAHVARRLRGGPLADLPVLSASAPFKAGGLGGPGNFVFIPVGDVLLRHAADLYIHPNTIMALRLNGAALLNWLERSVQGYCQITPGLADQPLINPALPSFLFDTISGLSYEIDLSVPGADAGGRRIQNPRWQGQPLDPGQEFILATNSYRGSGSGGFAPVDPASVVLAEHTANRDILVKFLASTRIADDAGQSPPGWRFKPMPGTSVVFDTSPNADRFAAAHPTLSLTPLSLMPSGFLRMRLTL